MARETANKRQKVESADALDDDLEYEVGSDSAGEAEQISPSDDDDDDDEESDANAKEGDDGDDGQGKRNHEPSASSSSKVEKVAKKQVSAEEKREKRKLRKESTRKRKAEELIDDNDDGNGTGSTVLSVDQQADTFAKLVRDTYAGQDLSSIELSDLTLPTSTFIDTTTFIRARTLGTLLEFIKTFSARERIEVSNKEVGRPHTLLLASSAIRVADLCRALAALKTKQGNVAKLFGKEKVETQVAWLGKSRVNVAVGLPARTMVLIQKPALKVDRVEQIYVDASYKDAKKRGMLGIKEVARDLIRLLGEGVLADRIKKGECRIILF